MALLGTESETTVGQLACHGFGVCLRDVAVLGAVPYGDWEYDVRESITPGPSLQHFI